MVDLAEYNKKRNFKVTREPQGAKRRSKDGNLLFVVQEHHARRLHYDFRLELDGVLKSWAVPKGISLDPHVKRLAVQTEDHPYKYAKFTGIIPKGQYGAGEVFRWDMGRWQPVGDPHAGLKKGHLDFNLKGKKLNGKFTLIRTKNSQWLLFKRTDAAAKLERPKTKKTDSLEFVPPQLAKLQTTPPAGDEWVHEIKFDGYRTQAHVQKKTVVLYTRNGLNWTKYYSSICKSLKKLKIDSAIFDGEVVWIDEEGHQSFQKLQNNIKAQSDKNLAYYIFDLLHLNGEDLRDEPLLERKKKLQRLLKSVPDPLRYSEHHTANAKDFFAASCKFGIEGMISKRGDSAYISGRGPQWVKTKCQQSDEFIIGGYTDPKGGRSGFGALLLGTRDENGKLRYSGRVGTGFDSTTLKNIKKELSKIESDHSPFEVAAPRGKEIHWVKPKLVAEVTFAQFTDEKILRAPVFHGLRPDKAPAEVKISHPERIIYEEEGITKEQVAMYYQVVAEFMMPHLLRRPLALVRCPTNSKEKCFFQKHLPGGKGLISVETPEELLKLIQFGALEIHTWNSRLPKKNYPDQFVIDFDPGPGVKWQAVIDAAFELREILSEAGLKSFVKTTGGKGLHVHVPVEPKADFKQMKAFTKALALQMVAKSPTKYVAEMAKAKRNKKIFIDYLRNGDNATAIAPYCLRARPRSSVAMPISWEELPKIKSGDQFTMAAALAHIAKRKKDPWSSYVADPLQ